MPHSHAAPKTRPAPRRARCGNARRRRGAAERPSVDERLMPMFIDALVIAGAVMASAAAGVPYSTARAVVALTPEEKERLAAAGLAVARCRAAASADAQAVGFGAALTALVAAKVELAMVAAEVRAEDGGAEPALISRRAAWLLVAAILAPLAILAGVLILQGRERGKHAE